MLDEIVFIYEGKVYALEGVAYNNASRLVFLPTGRLLKIISWITSPGVKPGQIRLAQPADLTKGSKASWAYRIRE